MTDKQLRRLRRRELLELLLLQEREIASLQEKLTLAQQALAQRELHLQQAGSIAQAALELNGVFAAAQAAADQYLQSVKAQNP